jgi:hypothetical protein
MIRTRGDHDPMCREEDEKDRMITIRRSPTADTRSCDPGTVTIDQLLASSTQHTHDVYAAMEFFRGHLLDAAVEHDEDKRTEIEKFHADFVTGFRTTEWWDNHRKTSRHHLQAEDGVPEDVNLIDVLECVADCVMAGMGRTGKVTPVNIPHEVLSRALANTVDLLKAKVEVVDA